MASGPPPGAALLIAGYGWVDETGRTDAVVQTLGQLGETLLATAATWRIRRLSPTSGELHTPDRANLKRHLVELAQEPVAVAMLAVAGMIGRFLGEPALVAGSRYRDFPEDATLPLSWIRERLQSCRADCVLVAVSAQGDHLPGEARAWLDVLATSKPTHVIAVEAAGPGFPAMSALLTGLCGEATDPRTGTVTLQSMGEHLARTVPGLAMQSSTASGTLAHAPPLGGLWDLGLSHTMQASHRLPARPSAPDTPEDLLQVTLPGRFRIERVLAQGSFGIVYRARQLMVERDVAIKVLQAGIDPSSKNGRLFVQEIQSVGRLEHPNVVRIYHADIAPDGRLFYAMELLVGRDLQQTVAEEGHLARDRAIALVRQLLAGLGAAHNAGLVHADVKPANAFVVDARDEERLVLLDFGMARLRPRGRAAESAGGTPAYMAPEQLHEGRVDARSDLFAAALVLVTLLTGWRRQRAEELVPPLEDIQDDGLRTVLARALAVDPTERFQTAGDFADALAGKAPHASQPVAIRPPFRHLAPLTEADRGRLHGRDRDIAALAEHVLYRRAVIYTAPSGSGKTSLLRAGLVPRLEALDARPVYLLCRADAADVLPSTIWPGAESVAKAIHAFHAEHGGKLVLILDQLEVLLSEDPRDFSLSRDSLRHGLFIEVLAFERWPVDADVTVVLSVREDFLARLISLTQRVEPGIPVLRLGPLGPDGAREAIMAPLAEARLTITPELLDALLADLQTAAATIGVEMGWGQMPAVYPPHLQLACSVLYESLGSGEAELTLAHYRRLGGLDAIVGEYLDRVVETELDAGSAAVARDLFLALVTSAHTRAMRTEAELMDIVGGRHGPERVVAVLKVLLARGLLVRVRAPGGEAGWELIHDSLVPRVLGWIDRRDLARRRAVELVRYHLRRSRPGAPSLLDRAELRELRPYADAIGELETEWASRRGGSEAWTPARLVARSRSAVRRGTTLVAVGAALILVGGGIALKSNFVERSLRDRNIGRFSLEVAVFDWDEQKLQAIVIPVGKLSELTWQLREPDPDDLEDPGDPVPDILVVRGAPTPSPDRMSIVEHIEARGGRAYLSISGRGARSEHCPPSTFPLRQLPGYPQRNRAEPVVRVLVPSCQATRTGMILVPAGRFVSGGVGEPASKSVAEDENEPPEREIDLPGFWIDRTEVTNAAFALYAQPDSNGIEVPKYPATKALKLAGGPMWPVSNLTWAEARSYCRYLGKDLPTSEQWQKSVRGGILLPGGQVNPFPRRNLPWAGTMIPAPAKLGDAGTRGPAPVGTFPVDSSPYGVLDLAGNVQEWTASTPVTGGQQLLGFRIARGGNWDDVTTADLVDFMALENTRSADYRNFALGMRCQLSDD